MPSCRALGRAGAAVAFALVAGLAAGCGSGGAATPKLKDSDPPDEYVSRVGLGWCPVHLSKMPSRAKEAPSRLFQPLTWVEATGIVQVASPSAATGGLLTARLTGVTRFRRTGPTVGPELVVTLPKGWFDKAVSTLNYGEKGSRTLVAGLDEGRQVRLLADHWMSIHRVSFIGDCAYRDLTDPLDQYIFAHAVEYSEADRPEVEVLRTILSEPRGELARDFAKFVREYQFE